MESKVKRRAVREMRDDHGVGYAAVLVQNDQVRDVIRAAGFGEREGAIKREAERTSVRRHESCGEVLGGQRGSRSVWRRIKRRKGRREATQRPSALRCRLHLCGAGFVRVCE